MSQGIVYFNHGVDYLERLGVSLFSLRKHWRGEVAIVDTKESGDGIYRLASRFDVEIIPVKFIQREKNSCYCQKASVWRNSPFVSSLQVDSDTIFASSPQGLLDQISDVKNPPAVLTQFSDWVTTGSPVRERIECWRGVKVGSRNCWDKTLRPDDLVAASLADDFPAINTGVIGYRGNSQFLQSWERLTHAGWDRPLTDEIAAQLLARVCKHMIVSDRYNCSPVYGKDCGSAVIWHFHGSRHRKSQAREIWEPMLSEFHRTA